MTAPSFKRPPPLLMLLFTSSFFLSPRHLPFRNHLATHSCPSVTTLALILTTDLFGNTYLIRQSSPHALAVIHDSMAGPNDKAFRSMLRSSTIKKACDQNAVSNHERDIKTMSELAGDMARGMKISKRASRKKRAIGAKEAHHEARVRTLPSRSSLTDFAYRFMRKPLLQVPLH